MPFVLTFVLLFFIGFPGVASISGPESVSDCSEVNLSTLRPRWSQGTTHMCYAFSVATLIDQYRFSHGDKDFEHTTSPLLLAMRTVENFNALGSTFSGGKVEHAISTARQFGSCSAKIISDKLGPYSLDTLLKNLQIFYQRSFQMKDTKTRAAKKIYQFLKNAGLKTEDLPSADEIEEDLILSQDEFITKILLTFCTDNKMLDNLPALKLLFQPQVGPAQILDRMNNLLLAKTPFGINFCSNVVTDSSYQGSFNGDQWYCKDQLNHSAVVVGRKRRNGQCQFLIQDTGCTGYAKKGFACQDNQYWLDASQLLTNTHGIFWLD